MKLMAVTEDWQCVPGSNDITEGGIGVPPATASEGHKTPSPK